MNTTRQNCLLILAWTIVIVPLSWGVWQSIQKSLPLLSQSEPGRPDNTSTRNSP
jgi:hypothetical protein